MLFLIIIALPSASYAQYAGNASSEQDIYVINVDKILDSYGLGFNERIIRVNSDSVITLVDPLVIMGGGIDALEREGFEIYTSSNPIDPERVLDDSTRAFEGQSIENYDLIVVGGPDHNAYAKELVDRGIVKYSVADIKMPGGVIESALLQGGNTAIVVGDVSGYAYHRKDLPLNGILPEKYAATVAVLCGMGLGLLGSTPAVDKFFTSIWNKIWKLIQKFIVSYASKIASKKETEIRKIGVDKNRKLVFFGFSWRELGTAAFSAILFGLAFIIANRLDLFPGNIWVYVMTGGLVLVLHELGHRLVAHKSKIDSEYQFWGMGTIILMLTAWLFGMAFAQSGRFLIEKKDASPRSLALITLTGPAISLVLSILFLPLVLFGGILGQIGMLGFTMNLVTVVYNLMPFTPMDGKSIFEWSKLFWALLFVPITLFFLVMTFFVLG